MKTIRFASQTGARGILVEIKPNTTSGLYWLVGNGLQPMDGDWPLNICAPHTINAYEPAYGTVGTVFNYLKNKNLKNKIDFSYLKLRHNFN